MGGLVRTSTARTSEVARSSKPGLANRNFSAVRSLSASQPSDEGVEVFQSADAMGLEGILSKRLGSIYRSGDSKAWLKTKAYAHGEFEVIGVEMTSTGAPSALLAMVGKDGPEYVGNAFVTLPATTRDAFWLFAEKRSAVRSIVHGMRQRKGVTWLQPGLRASVLHLRGEGLLRHATLTGLSLVD